MIDILDGACVSCLHPKEQHDGKGPWGGCSGCTVASGHVCLSYVPMESLRNSDLGRAVAKFMKENPIDYEKWDDPETPPSGAAGER